jgi:hypothetical protein
VHDTPVTTDPLDDLARIVDDAARRMLAMTDLEASRPRAPGRWMPREIVGHLIDSAVNNQGRFVRARLQDDLIFPGYDQDGWVRVQQYRDRSWPELVGIWRASNLQILALIRATPPAERDRPRARHNLHEIGFQPLPEGADATLGFMMRDYVLHLQHHLRQVFATSTSPSPSTHPT